MVAAWEALDRVAGLHDGWPTRDGPGHPRLGRPQGLAAREYLDTVAADAHDFLPAYALAGGCPDPAVAHGQANGREVGVEIVAVDRDERAVAAGELAHRQSTILGRAGDEAEPFIGEIHAHDVNLGRSGREDAVIDATGDGLPVFGRRDAKQREGHQCNGREPDGPAQAWRGRRRRGAPGVIMSNRRGAAAAGCHAGGSDQ